MTNFFFFFFLCVWFYNIRAFLSKRCIVIVKWIFAGRLSHREQYWDWFVGVGYVCRMNIFRPMDTVHSISPRIRFYINQNRDQLICAFRKMSRVNSFISYSHILSKWSISHCEYLEKKKKQREYNIRPAHSYIRCGEAHPIWFWYILCTNSDSKI